MTTDTAKATRRIVTGLIWLFAMVVAYPYIPGSGSEAFKGLSVLDGLMISLGSTGLINQVMSGFVILYSGAIRTGEYAKIGNIEGTVREMGLLATKIRTPTLEYITVPNAVIIANPTTNYSRFADRHGAVVSTTVTIGYDTPWRQVHAMLLRAAKNTNGVRNQPPPRILQRGLSDFYAEYTLIFYIDKPQKRTQVLSELHGMIQDEFNEHGVQIMSPHFNSQPEDNLYVPKDKWFLPPARPPTPGEK
jgi:small-conductance mechanosensitive channel